MAPEMEERVPVAVVPKGDREVPGVEIELEL